MLKSAERSGTERSGRRTSRGRRVYLVVWNGRILHAGLDCGEARAFQAGLRIESAELIVGLRLPSQRLPVTIELC